jgi:hypothetical protein
MTDVDMQIRVNSLNLNALRAALYSIENASILERAVDAGEQYQKLMKKISTKDKSSSSK